jgi:extracellular factor (EF) 3-hydroxypalmitic acid methyl ester biosynthesis protein
MQSNNAATTESAETLVMCQTGQGLELHGTLLKLSRFQAVFEIYSPSGMLRLSEALSEFKILVQGKLLYSGRAVITNLIHMGSVVVCEAALDEAGLVAVPSDDPGSLRSSFEQFLKDSNRVFKVYPEFKVVMADMQALFLDLRLWMDQMELSVRSQPTGSRTQREYEILHSLEGPVLPLVAAILEKFEALANQVESEARAAHRVYMKRQIHPVVMCSPFLYRTFRKPLGYAGDYEMVNMMLRDPFEGASMFAKLVNRIFLNTPPVLAHQNRIGYLTRHLIEEVRRTGAHGQPLRVCNVGCGPAHEIQNFLREEELSNRADFTLLDFNQETLDFTIRILNEIKTRHQRNTSFQAIKRSVHSMLKDSGKPVTSHKYDLVYCAGLFDYLSDQVSKRLTALLHDMVAPGGLLLVTNVCSINPSRNWMEYVLDWHLVYRSAAQLAALAPGSAPETGRSVQAIGDGVNIALEVRRTKDVN